MTPEGKLSVIETCVYAELLGFCSVIYNLLVPLTGVEDGEKYFDNPIA